MATIVLHGDLERFGREYQLNVAHPAEAVRALIAQLDGFKKRLLAGNFFVRVDDRYLTSAIPELRAPIDPDATIHLVPVIEGSGSAVSGALQIIAGVALVVIGIYYPPSAAWGAGLIGAGIGLGISGAVTLLIQPPPIQEAKDEEASKASSSFGRLGNGPALGAAIPVILGSMRVGSKVLSQGIETRNA